MKENFWVIMLLVTVILCAVGLGLVYWFEYRPAEIRLLCWEEERVNARRPPGAHKRRVRSYQECLQENGLSR